ncbi:hypothetical protein BpHYR1_050540 [Brachionus plicatilis]|uniref:Uncharacterized protein n=1 Tax=Brachionus plicatilis TaxID=10195 RepID=A0A3M7Q488_BRAPC|nr:hypothetical protein BpHYR1_050540 [Brachionus plicatilis]
MILGTSQNRFFWLENIYFYDFEKYFHKWQDILLKEKILPFKAFFSHIILNQMEDTIPSLAAGLNYGELMPAGLMAALSLAQTSSLGMRKNLKNNKSPLKNYFYFRFGKIPYFLQTTFDVKLCKLTKSYIILRQIKSFSSVHQERVWNLDPIKLKLS